MPSFRDTKRAHGLLQSMSGFMWGYQQVKTLEAGDFHRSRSSRCTDTINIVPIIENGLICDPIWDLLSPFIVKWPISSSQIISVLECRLSSVVWQSHYTGDRAWHVTCVVNSSLRVNMLRLPPNSG